MAPEGKSSLQVAIVMIRTYHDQRHPLEGIAAVEPSAAAVFRAVPERSALLVRVRSNVGPIEFGAIGLTGTFDAPGPRSSEAGAQPLHARLELRVDRLTSGNALYDAELHRRIDTRMFPTAVVELESAEELDAERRFRVGGPVTFHGVTRSLSGVVQLVAETEGHVTVTGEQVFDIRDFDVASPTMLMLKIYPDVRVYLQVEADRVG